MNLYAPIEDAAERPIEPTYNYPMEQAVLGLLLLDNGHVDRVAGQLVETDFLHELHRRVFVDVVRVVQAGQVASPKTLEPHYQGTPGYLDVPEFKYLGQLIARAPAVANIDACIKTLKTMARFRGVRQTLVESIEAVDQRLPEADPAEVISAIEGRLYLFVPKAANERPATSFAEAAEEAIRARARGW